MFDNLFFDLEKMLTVQSLILGLIGTCISIYGTMTLDSNEIKILGTWEMLSGPKLRSTAIKTKWCVQTGTFLISLSFILQFFIQLIPEQKLLWSVTISSLRFVILGYIISAILIFAIAVFIIYLQSKRYKKLINTSDQEISASEQSGDSLS